MRGMRPGIWGSSGELLGCIKRGNKLAPTNEGNIDASWGKWATLRGPAQAVLQDPRVEAVLCFLGEAKVRGSDALQDVVVVFGGAEHARRRVGNVPTSKDQNQCYVVSIQEDLN